MVDLEILTNKEGTFILSPSIRPAKYPLGFPKEISVTPNLEYRRLKIIYESQGVLSNEIEIINIFAYDHGLLQTSSPDNAWACEIPFIDKLTFSCDFN